MGWGSSTRRGGGRKLHARPRNFVFLGFLRAGETTIKMNFSLFEGGGGLGGKEANRPKRCFSWETPRQ